MRLAARLMPGPARREWLGEASSILYDAPVGARRAIARSYLAAAPLVIAAAWAGALAGHRYDLPGRMRASLAAVLAAWTVLAGLTAVFASFTQTQPWLLRDLPGPRHLVIQWSYWVFDAAAGASLLAVAAGGLPLWLVMLRQACRERCWRETAWLLAPAVVPVVYLGVASAVLGPRAAPIQPPFAPAPSSFTGLANHYIGPWWLMVLGFAAGLMAAAGPGLALHSMRPRGPGVTLAARAAGLAVAAMGLAGAASIVAAAGLHAWGVAPYRQGWPFAVYLLLFLAAIGVAGASAARGIRAARASAAA
ncbi:MAG TPA: hypothetical protein VGH53_30035 [Streptosporangiaceae bacterium]|jgi:hypothetical protein